MVGIGTIRSLGKIFLLGNRYWLTLYEFLYGPECQGYGVGGARIARVMELIGTSLVEVR